MCNPGPPTCNHYSAVTMSVVSDIPCWNGYSAPMSYVVISDTNTWIVNAPVGCVEQPDASGTVFCIVADGTWHFNNFGCGTGTFVLVSSTSNTLVYQGPVGACPGFPFGVTTITFTFTP